MNFITRFSFALCLLIFMACNDAPRQESVDTVTTKQVNSISMKEEAVAYSIDTTQMIGFLAYDSANTAKRPVVMIVHEWWGLNDYPKQRAHQLAEMGYLAMAIDLYGNGATASNPSEAGKMAGPFYENPEMARIRFDAALAIVKSLPMADSNRIVAIGYCFGGAQVINFAKMGEPLKGVVSFHGDLNIIRPTKNVTRVPILVCHGAADNFVPDEEISTFRHQMDSVNAPYTFKSYADSKHAFTNPNATVNGRRFNIPIAYNAAADTASWNDMKVFFEKVLQ